MKDIVSFETALRLKESGFPQPNPEYAQIWYSINGDSILISKSSSRQIDFLIYGVRSIYNDESRSLSNDGCVFAPTATDILRQLPERPIVWNIQEDAWFVWEPPELTSRIITITMDDNPAEAAAQAWLSVNEK